MCRVARCCCCCSLEKGCRVIAFLGKIGGGSLIIQGFRGLATNQGSVNPDSIINIGIGILTIVTYALLLWGTL